MKHTPTVRPLLRLLLSFAIFTASPYAMAGTHSMVENGSWSQDSIQDVEAFEGHYDFNAQLEAIQELKTQGHELRLFIRKNKGPLTTQELLREAIRERGKKTKIFETTSKIVWVVADISGKGAPALVNNQAPYLWMNVDVMAHLTMLDDQMFSQIVVENGAWTHLDRDNAIRRFNRILTGPGSLFFVPIESHSFHDDGKHIQFEPDFVPLKVSLPSLEDLLDEEVRATREAKLLSMAHGELVHRYEIPFRSQGFYEVLFHHNQAYPMSSEVISYFEARKSGTAHPYGH